MHDIVITSERKVVDVTLLDHLGIVLQWSSMSSMHMGAVQLKLKITTYFFGLLKQVRVEKCDMC